ncbi:hypothetical protein T492DRAFT_856252, partial [Pavlovales sp. CCMP2436]
GDDVLLHAETGSGKTLAFLLPALCALEGDAPWQLLVIAPTNLLIRQIATVARDLGHGEADVCALLSLESQSPTFKMQVLYHYYYYYSYSYYYHYHYEYYYSYYYYYHHYHYSYYYHYYYHYHYHYYYYHHHYYHY